MPLAPSTLVATQAGFRTLDTLAGTNFTAYDGTEYLRASAQPAPERPLVETLLTNGLRLHTSPEHRFWVSTAKTEPPTWIAQHEVVPGDRILMPYKRYDAPFDPAYFSVGEDFDGWRPSLHLVHDPSLWRMLGFALGQGSFPEERLSEGGFSVHVHAGHQDRMLRRFAACCREHGLDTVRTDRERPMLRVMHVPFQRWLRALGFVAAPRNVLRVPQTVFGAPAWIRESVLQGFFSSLGEWYCHSAKNYVTPHVYVGHAVLCESVLRLLWSVGVAAAIEQKGFARRGDIFVRDLGAFQEQINFLQDAKRIPWVERPVHRARRWDTIRPELANCFVRWIRSEPGWKQATRADQHRMGEAYADGSGLRRHVVRQVCRVVGVPIPPWLDYHHAQVDAVRPLAERVHMYRLESPGVHAPRYVSDFVLSR